MLVVPALVASLLMAPHALIPGASPDVVRAGAPLCETGWREPVESPEQSMYDVHRLAGDSAIAVGTEQLFSGQRRYVTSWFDGTAWTTSLGPDGRPDAALMAVAGTPPNKVWAAGTIEADALQPLVLRWTGDRWVTKSPPRSTTGGQVLSAIDVDPSGRPWAVGMAVGPTATRTALVWQRTASGWVRHDLGVTTGTALTAVRARAVDDVWAVGTKSTKTGIRPLLLHWDGAGWTAQVFQHAGIDARLAGMVEVPGGDLLAVGWQTSEAGTTLPLVLRHRNGAWSSLPGPEFGGAFSTLSDVSVGEDGRPWVVGSVYRDSVDLYVPMAARLDGKDWTIWPRAPGTLRYLTAASGDLAHGGWTAGRAAAGSIRVTGCEPEIVAPGPDRRGGRGEGDRRAGPPPGGEPQEDLADEGLPRPRQGLATVPALPAPVEPTDFAARDVAPEVGLGITTFTYGATIADLDGDGRADILVSGHGGLPKMFFKQQGAYVRQPSALFRQVDRHACDVGRITGGPLPDIVCTVGANRGVGYKANELWVDPASGISTEQGATMGLADPVGRGREMALFDADDDGDLDLFLGTSSVRYDSQPSPNRLMLNDGTGRFRWDPRSGLTRDRGAKCALPVDFDRDGDIDLALCAVSGVLADSAAIMLYRNDGTGRFTDVTKALGLKPIGERDIAIRQLGGGQRPDVVQLSADRIRVSLWQSGRYVNVYERRLVAGRALATGDVNGDGAVDIYLQRGGGKVNLPDLVLLNDGTGRRWTPVSIPSTSEGSAEDVVALDHDGNGRTDFLVLNGQNRPGPLQLIAFYPPDDQP